jgi:hypothetical protein
MSQKETWKSRKSSPRTAHNSHVLERLGDYVFPFTYRLLALLYKYWARPLDLGFPIIFFGCLLLLALNHLLPAAALIPFYESFAAQPPAALCFQIIFLPPSCSLSPHNHTHTPNHRKAAGIGRGKHLAVKLPRQERGIGRLLLVSAGMSPE